MIFFRKYRRALCGVLAISMSLGSAMVFALPLRFQDANGASFAFSAAPTRVISLAPHITELLFAAGAGQAVVGVSSYSNYPEAATRLPIVADYQQLYLEKILALKPTVVFAWKTGGIKQSQLDLLTRMHISVVVLEQSRLKDVALSLRLFGQLFQTQAAADQASQSFEQAIAGLKKTYQPRQAVPVFYQIWNRPVMTINQHHILNEVIELCGGVNPFASLPLLVPTIDQEAVLHAKPRVILTAGDVHSLDGWQKYTWLPAVKGRHLYALTDDWASRMGPRIALAAEEMCRYIDRARVG